MPNPPNFCRPTFLDRIERVLFFSTDCRPILGMQRSDWSSALLMLSADKSWSVCHQKLANFLVGRFWQVFWRICWPIFIGWYDENRPMCHRLELLWHRVYFSTHLFLAAIRILTVCKHIICCLPGLLRTSIINQRAKFYSDHSTKLFN